MRGQHPESGYDATPFLPDHGGLRDLRGAADDCRGCPLHEGTTGVVFGEGRQRAWLMLVGEQPGDREDQAGTPFVGPAGRVLDRCLDEAGIDRRDVYLTNAVKHFKFRRSGKRRIHQKPSTAEVVACHPWLRRELSVVRPRAVIALGAVAARAVVGRPTPIERNRGVTLRSADTEAPVYVTYHPSAALRRQDRDDARRTRDAIVETLGAARAVR